jgi:hypothetical protein
MSAAKSYSLLAIGCVAHSALLTAIVFFMGDIRSLVPPSLHDSVYYAWYLMILAWPIWGLFLWKSGLENKWIALLPVIVGLLIMIPVFFALWIMVVTYRSGGNF